MNMYSEDIELLNNRCIKTLIIRRKYLDVNQYRLNNNHNVGHLPIFLCATSQNLELDISLTVFRQAGAFTRHGWHMAH